MLFFIFEFSMAVPHDEYIILCYAVMCSAFYTDLYIIKSLFCHKSFSFLALTRRNQLTNTTVRFPSFTHLTINVEENGD